MGREWRALPTAGSGAPRPSVSSLARGSQAYTLESNQDFVDPEVLARAIGALDEVDRGKADGAPAAAPPLLTLESMGEIDAAFGLPDVGLIVEAKWAAGASVQPASGGLTRGASHPKGGGRRCGGSARAGRRHALVDPRGACRLRRHCLPPHTPPPLASRALPRLRPCAHCRRRLRSRVEPCAILPRRRPSSVKSRPRHSRQRMRSFPLATGRCSMPSRCRLGDS